MSEMKINIKNNGLSKGSVGWLAKNAKTIRVGNTTGGEKAAWLKDHDDEVIFCLASASYNSSDEFVSLTRGYSEDCIDFPVTDSCWEMIKVLIEKALELLEEDQEPMEITFS